MCPGREPGPALRNDSGTHVLWHTYMVSSGTIPLAEGSWIIMEPISDLGTPQRRASQPAMHTFQLERFPCTLLVFCVNLQI